MMFNKKNKKLNIGIDIDEVFRAKWLQFDRYYAMEFGEDGIPEDEPYVFDFFNDYKWEDTVEEIKELKEEDDLPDINPQYYQLDENGESLADDFIFKKTEKKEISAKELYHRFMYVDYLFELHGSTPIMYKNMGLHVNEFLSRYENNANFIVKSVENNATIPPTLFFLSRMTSRFKSYEFVSNYDELWNGIDVLITTNPEIIKKGAPIGKKIIKINRPYNMKLNKSYIDVLQLNDLLGNTKFEKLIKYKKNK